MKEEERKILKRLLEEKRIDKEGLAKLMSEKPEDEDLLSFLIRKGVISYKDVVDIAYSQPASGKKSFAEYGITFEDVYMIYEKNESLTYAVPYHHIRAVERRGNSITIHTGGIDKILISLESPDLAQALFDTILVYMHKSLLR